MVSAVRYKSFDLNFIAHPITGDIAMKTDNDAIKQSLKTLLMTMFGERPFELEFGSNLRAMLFDPVSPITAINLQKTIQQTIDNFEPRVEVESVVVSAQSEANRYECTLTYNIRNTQAPIVIDFILDRIR